MAYCAKAAALIVGVTGVFGVAQAQTVKPSPQQRATAPAPTKAVAPAPQPAAPDSRRFVTNENYFRAGGRTQPAASPAQLSGTPSSSAPAVNRVNGVGSVPAQPAIQQPAAPAIAAFISPSPLQPAVSMGSAPTAAANNISAAVDYTSGQLTVISDRASLGQVLKLIAGKTGAVVDVAPELQQEPVVAKLGPSPVRDVLTALLDSPRIDYIVFGTGDEPGSLQRIVVRRRQSFGNAGMGVMRVAPQPQVPAVGPGGNEMTQEQRMEEWKQQRAQMLEAEMKQSALDRENEKNQTPEPPAPQETPQQQENPPQR